jgi:hypothetical protein
VINKEANRNRAQIAAGSAPLEKLLNTSPTNTVNSFDAAVNMLLVTLSDPNMGAATQSIKDITAAVRMFTTEAERHPTAARIAMDIAAGVAVVGTATGALLLALFPLKSLINVAGWIKAFAVAETDAGVAAGIGATRIGGFTAGLARLLGPLALGYFAYQQGKTDFFHHGETDGHGLFREHGIANDLSNIFTEWKQVFSGQRDFWSGKPIELKGDLNVDGRKMGAFTARSMAAGMSGTQGGKTGFDGSMHGYPSGLPGGAAP